MRKSKQTTVRIDEKQYTKLRLKLMKAGKSFTEWLQEIVDSYLQSSK